MPALPLLDETHCTGCGDCVTLCPTDCLAMREGIPWLPRPEDCIQCALCVLICPVEALLLTSE